MKNLTIISIAVIVLAATVAISCSKEEIPAANTTSTTKAMAAMSLIDREQYRWISKKLVSVYNKTVQNSNTPEEFAEQLYKLSFIISVDGRRLYGGNYSRTMESCQLKWL